MIGIGKSGGNREQQGGVFKRVRHGCIRHARSVIRAKLKVRILPDLSGRWSGYNGHSSAAAGTTFRRREISRGLSIGRAGGHGGAAFLASRVSLTRSPFQLFGCWRRPASIPRNPPAAEICRERYRSRSPDTPSARFPRLPTKTLPKAKSLRWRWPAGPPAHVPHCRHSHQPGQQRENKQQQKCQKQRFPV